MVKWWGGGGREGILTIQGQTVKIPLQSPGKSSIFQFCPYFSTCLSLKSGKLTPIKIILSKLIRIDLLLHKVLSFEVENCGLRKHLKLGDLRNVRKALGG